MNQNVKVWTGVDWVLVTDLLGEITRLRNELHIAQERSSRVIAGHEQDITEITALRAENEKLRVALWDIHAVCNNWDWFIWMWPIRRIKRLARAALGEKHD